jgi:hypothetical protein
MIEPTVSEANTRTNTVVYHDEVTVSTALQLGKEVY